MTTAEKKEINDRIAHRRSSQATGCDHCNNGVVYIETESWGLVFKQCQHCGKEGEE